MKAIHQSAFLLYRQPIIMPARPVARTKELRCSLTTTSPAVKATSADDIDEEAMMMVSLSNLYFWRRWSFDRVSCLNGRELFAKQMELFKLSSM